MSEGLRRIAVALRWLALLWTSAVSGIGHYSGWFRDGSAEMWLFIGLFGAAPALLLLTIAWIVDGFSVRNKSP